MRRGGNRPHQTRYYVICICVRSSITPLLIKDRLSHVYIMRLGEEEVEQRDRRGAVRETRE